MSQRETTLESLTLLEPHLVSTPSSHPHISLLPSLRLSLPYCYPFCGDMSKAERMKILPFNKDSVVCVHVVISPREKLGLIRIRWDNLTR